MPLLLNYAHPFTEDHLTHIAALVGAQPEVRELAAQVDRSRPMVEVAVELAQAAGLSPQEWQTRPLLLNPLALAPLALALIAELHGRCGYFIPVLNIRPVADTLPPRYEVAEIIDLQQARDSARTTRTG